MRLTTALALALTPLFAVAENPPAGSWHFETQSGRADGVGTKHCQKFYMKKLETFSFKLDHHSTRTPTKRFPQPQSGTGDWGLYGPNGPNGPVPAISNPKPANSGSTVGQPIQPGGLPGVLPLTPPTKPSDPTPTGVWNGPVQPPKPAEEKPKCCLKYYTDDDCKVLDSEMCVEDKSDEKRNTKGRAPKEFRSFNIACTPDTNVVKVDNLY
ncbi:hypothetical protein E2P81_ATG08174 [Venturia nashicola]|nr:hypothetical protein E2P81_ATG08174 [Venturia nashicola]